MPLGTSAPRQHIHLVLPKELAERVRGVAERERRSLSTQIQVLVERALEQEAAAA